MQYMLILYAYDANRILVDPFKLQSNSDILQEYDVAYDTLDTACHAPNMNIMDNDASKELKRLL